MRGGIDKYGVQGLYVTKVADIIQLGQSSDVELVAIWSHPGPYQSAVVMFVQIMLRGTVIF